MNLDPLFELIGAKKPEVKPTWLEDLARDMDITEDPKKKEWWKTYLAAPASTLTAEYGAAASLLPYKKFIERPAVTSRWAQHADGSVDYGNKLREVAKSFGIKMVDTPPSKLIPQINDSFTIPNAAKDYYTSKGNLKANWKNFTLKDILSPDKWFIRQSLNMPSKLDPGTYQHIINAPSNLHPGMLAKEMGSLIQNPIFQKIRTPAEILSILGIGAPAMTNDEDTAQRLAIGGTVAQLPLLSAELDAASHGSNILRRVGASGSRALFPYLGIPAYAISTAIPSMTYLSKKHLFGGYNQQQPNINHAGFSEFTSSPDTN
jgi:hypothetical protein